MDTVSPPHNLLPTAYPNIGGFLRAVRGQLWLLVLVVAAAVGVAAAVTLRQEPIYRASAKVVIGQGVTVFVPEVGTVTQPAAQTMRTLLESDVVARRVIRRLGLRETPQKLLSRLAVTFAPDSAVLDLTYDSPNKAQAVATLGAITSEFSSLINQSFGAPKGVLVPKGQVIEGPLTIRIFDQAHLRPGQVAPRPASTLVFAGILGLLVGGILAFVRERTASVIRTRGQAEQSFAAPVIGAVPRSIQRPLAAAFANGRPTDPRLIDAIRLLSVNLQYGHPAAQSQTIVVTSARPERGKANVVAHLAVSLAQTGEDTICIEADLRDPQLHRYLPLDPQREGFAEVLAEDVDLTTVFQELALGTKAPAAWNGAAAAAGADVDHGETDAAGVEPVTLMPPPSPWLRPQKRGRLRVVGAGRRDADQSVVTPDRIRELVLQLGQEARFVIFNAPPILEAAETVALAGQASGVLIVATEGATTTEAAAAARTTLERLSSAQLGVVLVGSS